MAELLTREVLDEMVATGCQIPGCSCKDEPMFLRSLCHPSAGTYTSYFEGVITVECAVCDTPIARLAVADC